MLRVSLLRSCLVEMISLFSVLGLQENASDTDVGAAYASLCIQLEPANFKEGTTTAASQAAKCLAAIANAHKILTTPELRKLYSEQRTEFIKGESREETRPRLGQLCVASGMISMEQLRDAVEEQIKTSMPLGEVLQSKKYISQAELDGLLLGQEMIDIPSAVTDPFAIRLISLGLLTEDMGLIAQMEHRAQAIPVADIVTRHGWVDSAVRKIIR